MRSFLQSLKRAVGQWKRGARVCDDNEPILPVSDEAQRNGAGRRLSALFKITRLPLSRFACTSPVCLGESGAGDEVLAVESGGEARTAADINNMGAVDHMHCALFMGSRR